MIKQTKHQTVLKQENGNTINLSSLSALLANVECVKNDSSKLVKGNSRKTKRQNTNLQKNNKGIKDRKFEKPAYSLKNFEQREAALKIIPKILNRKKAESHKFTNIQIVQGLLYHVLFAASNSSNNPDPVLLVKSLFRIYSKLNNDQKAQISSLIKDAKTISDFNEQLKYQLGFYKIYGNEKKKSINLLHADYYIKSLATDKKNAENDSVRKDVYQLLKTLLDNFKTYNQENYNKAAELFIHVLEKSSTTPKNSDHFKNYIEFILDPKDNFDRKQSFLYIVFMQACLSKGNKLYLLKKMQEFNKGNLGYYKFYLSIIKEAFIPNNYWKLTDYNEDRLEVKKIIAQEILKYPKFFKTLGKIDDTIDVLKTIFSHGYLGPEDLKKLMTQFIDNTNLDNEKALNFINFITKNYPAIVVKTVAESLGKHAEALGNDTIKHIKHQLLDTVFYYNEDLESNNTLIANYVEKADLNSKETLNYLIKTAKSNANLIDACAEKLIDFPKDVVNVSEKKLKHNLLNTIFANNQVKINYKAKLIANYVKHSTLDKKETFEYLRHIVVKNPELAKPMANTLSLDEYKAKIGKKEYLDQKIELYNTLFASKHVKVDTKKVLITNFLGSADLTDTPVLVYLKQLTDKSSNVKLPIQYVAHIADELTKKYTEALGNKSARLLVTQLITSILDRYDVIKGNNELKLQELTEAKQKLLAAFFNACSEDFITVFNYAKKIIESKQELRNRAFLDMVHVFVCKREAIAKEIECKAESILHKFFSEYYKHITPGDNNVNKDLQTLVGKLDTFYKGEKLTAEFIEATIESLKGDKYLDCLPKISTSWW